MRFFSPRICAIIAHIRVVGILWLLLPGMAIAQELRYEVNFNAPKNLQLLLKDNLDILRWRGNPQLDSEQLLRLYRIAPEQIKTIIATEGYFKAQIKSEIVRETSPWQITFSIEPGPAVKVAAVDIRLAKALPPEPQASADDVEEQQAPPIESQAAPELLETWKLPVGAIFQQAQWEGAKRALLRETSIERYPRAQILRSEASVDIEKNEVRLLLILARGPEVRFGGLHIEGLQRYDERLVRNHNIIQEGGLYTEKALLDLQQTLQDTNFFSNVVVTALFTPAMDAQSGSVKVPIHVKLTEHKRKKVDAGLGLSTNTGARVQLNFENLSRGGWQGKLGTTIETWAQNLSLDLIAPTSAKGHHDSYGTSFVRSTIAGETTATAKLAFNRSWGNPKLSREIQIELLSERKTIQGLGTTSTRSLPISYEVKWRQLDNLLQPKRGYLLQAKIGGAPLPIFGGQSFLRLYTRGQWYLPLGKQGLLLTRGELGAVASRETENIPSAYLFRAGGDQSVRGYGFQQLGVREAGAVTGGRYLATGSLEYQHWWQPAWGAAFFIDGGNAANQPSGLRPELGYGVGGRWNSPVGPINLDVAYGHAVRKVRLHFSLGLAF